MAALSAKGPAVSASEEAKALACRRALEWLMLGLRSWWWKEITQWS